MHASDSDFWRFVSSGNIVTPLVVHDSGEVSFAADDGNVYRLHEQGSLRWRLRVGESPSGHIAGLHDGSVLIAFESGAIKRIGPAGRVSWRLAAAANPLQFIAASNLGVIYLAYEGGGVRALNYAGRPLWSISIGEGFRHQPLLGSDGRIYFVTTEDELMTFSSDGRIRSSYELEATPSLAAISPENSLVLAYESVDESGEKRGSVEKVDPEKGTSSSVAETNAPVQELFVDNDGTIGILQSNGQLLRLYVDAKMEAAKNSNVLSVVDEEVEEAVSTGDGHYVVIDAAGVVKKVDYTGAARVTIRTAGNSNTLSSPAIGRSGHIVFTDSHWFVWGFSSRRFSEPAWYGQNAHGLRDGRIFTLSPPTRRELRDVGQFRVMTSIVEGGDVDQIDRVLEGIEEAIRHGALKGSVGWISEVLVSVAGPAAGAPKLHGDRVSTEIAIRALTALGEIGDRVAVRSLQSAARNAAGKLELETVMTAIARSGYGLGDRRASAIDEAYRRAGGAGVSASLDLAYIRAVERVWDQGDLLNPEVIGRVSALPDTGADENARREAERLLRRILFGGRRRVLRF